MLEKIIGVSPSQQGVTQDSKKPESAPKNDFENVLQAKLQNKSRKNENKAKDDSNQENLKTLRNEKSSIRQESKSADRSNDKLNDKSTDKSSRGNKKKMTEDDDSPSENVLMVSNVMASPESEFEIPDEEQNLAEINLDVGEVKNEIDVDQLTLTKVRPDVSAQKIDPSFFTEEVDEADQALVEQLLTQRLLVEQQNSSIPSQFGEIVRTDSAAGDIETETTSKVFEQKSKAVDESIQSFEDFKLTMQNKLPSKMESANGDLPIEISQVAQAEPTKTQQAETLESSFSTTLSSEDQNFQHVLEETGILTQMKSFEEVKGLKGDKAIDFEQKVLTQLKQEFHELTAKVNQSSAKGGFSNLSHEKNETPDKSLIEAKPESLKTDSILHVGQNHYDFRSQILQKINPSTETTSLDQLEAHHDKNIQEVMKQAQVLVKQGGGEMTVKMSPDGIGEMQLKVMLDGGKVNIEMQTADRSIKKMIEDSLSELKSGLAAHRLNVEHVRIDTVNATNTEQQASLQANLGQSGAQYESREFWKQFQEGFNNNARKSTYNELIQTGDHRATNPTPLRAVNNSYRSNGRTGSTLNQVA